MLLDSDRARAATAAPQEREASPGTRTRPRAAMPAEGLEAQVQFLRPEGEGYEAQAARLRPPAVVQREEAGAAKKSRMKDKGEVSLGRDFEIESVKAWQDQANARLDELEGSVRKAAHEALGQSAPNKVELELELEARGDVAGATQETGEGETRSGPKLGAEATFTGKLGWSLTLADGLVLGGLDPHALEVDRDVPLGGEQGHVKAAPSGELFVGVDVEAKAGIEGAAQMGGVLDQLARFVGAHGAAAAQGTGQKAGNELKTKADDTSSPVPKIGKKGAGENGPKSDAPSSVVAAEAGVSGKAFAGAEVSVGGKAALAWRKRKPEEYQSAIEHYVTLALAVNPLTMPFAPAALALFKAYPDLMKDVAPTLMGPAGLVDVATVEASITGQAGAGAEGALEAKFANGRLSFKASGEGTLGFGGGADAAIDADVLESMRLVGAVEGGLLSELTGAIGNQAAALGDRAKEVWTQLLLGLSRDLGKLQAFLKECGTNAVIVLMQVWDELVRAGVTVTDLVKASWQGISANVTLVTELLGKLGADAIEPMWEAVKGSADAIATFLGIVVDDASSHASAFLNLLWQESWSVLGTVWGAAGAALRKAFFDYIKSQGWGSVGELLAIAAGKIDELIALIWSGSTMADLAVVFQHAASQWGALWQVVWAKSSMEQLGRMVAKAAVSDIPNWANALWQKANIDQLVRLVGQLGARMWDFIAAIAPKLSVWDLAKLGG